MDADENKPAESSPERAPETATAPVPESAPAAESATAGAPAPPPVVPPANLGTIDVIDGPTRRTFRAAPGGRILLGSDTAATIRLSDPRVSLSYASIERIGPGWLVNSLDPANPIWILDETGRPRPVLEELGLRSGTLIAGSTVLLLYPPEL